MTEIEDWQHDAAEIRDRHAAEREERERKERLDELRPLVRELVREELQRQ